MLKNFLIKAHIHTHEHSHPYMCTHEPCPLPWLHFILSVGIVHNQQPHEQTAATLCLPLTEGTPYASTGSSAWSVGKSPSFQKSDLNASLVRLSPLLGLEVGFGVQWSIRFLTEQIFTPEMNGASGRLFSFLIFPSLWGGWNIHQQMVYNAHQVL